MNQVVELKLTGMPEVLAKIRSEVARMLREAADDCSPEAAREIHEVATAFEVGLSERPHE